MSAGPLFIREPVAFTRVVPGNGSALFIVPTTEEATLIEEVTYFADDPAAAAGVLQIVLYAPNANDPEIQTATPIHVAAYAAGSGTIEASGRIAINVTLPVGASLAFKHTNVDTDLDMQVVALGGIVR